MRTNTGLTLYNKHMVAGAETYQRTELAAVEWENRKNANVLSTGGNIAADQAAIYIPKSAGGDYVKPKAWQALADKTGKWTLQFGDYVVKGLVEDEITAAIPADPPDPAVPAFQITQLKAKYDDVLQITSVDTMDLGSLGLQHWKLSTK